MRLAVANCGSILLARLRRYPVSVQMSVALAAIVLVGNALVFTGFSVLPGSCPELAAMICGIAIILGLLYWLVSLFLLPEVAIVAILAGAFHIIRRRRFDWAVVGSMFATMAILAFLVWIHFRVYTEMVVDLFSLRR